MVGTVRIGDKIDVIDATKEDEIKWRWTADGEFSTKSAYLAQFQGSFSKIKLLPIWRAWAEPKCRFFAWTLLHRKLLTANNMLRRGWLQDPICRLCKQEPETIGHLFKDCVYTKMVWDLLLPWFGLASLRTADQQGSVYKWWRRLRLKVAKHERRAFDGFIIYFWWEIWKERNRRSFQQVEKSTTEVAFIIKEDLNLQQAARSFV